MFHRSNAGVWNSGTPDIAAIIRAILGDPNPALSRGPRWRYGSRGSLSVDVARGLWCDHEAGQGGGLLALVQRQRGGSSADAARWLEAEGRFHRSIAGAWNSGTRIEGRRGAWKNPVSRDADPDSSWLRLWRASQSPEGSPVEGYLSGRSLFLPAEPGRVLRYHPACPFGAEKLPAMVALIRNAETGEPQGLHRTALTPMGERARGPDGAKLPKMMLGVAGGGAIMLSPNWQVEASLAIAEGIESALAGLRRQPWLPTWAALSAGGVKGFPVLAGLEALTVYADADAAGIDASRALCQRYAEAGRYAEMVRPTSAGADMADLDLCLAQNN